MTWDGDISRMGQLANNLRKLGTVPSRASELASERIADLIAQEFATESDPYCNPWAPHAQATIERHGAHDILDLTGDMRRSVDVRPMRGAGVSVTIDHPGEDHQTGWDGPQGSGPARPVLPMGTMPAEWSEAIKSAVVDTARAAMGAP